MSNLINTHAATHESRETDETSKTLLGFWIYLMTDSVLFGSLFATYAVLHGNTNGGPSGKELFNPPFVLAETMLLLVSSYTIGLAILSLHRRKRSGVVAWLSVTTLLGVGFLVMELTEFSQLMGEGHSWAASGFLSAFFTLIGTHGLHILAGLIWAGFLLWQVVRRGLTSAVSRRLMMFSLFWHFLDIVWICIFTVVYMIGVA